MSTPALQRKRVYTTVSMCDIVHSMGIRAAMHYLYTLRDAAGITRAKLAALVQVTENTIWRVETGRQEPSGSLLVAIAHALHADWSDVEYLVVNNATDQDAEARAQAHMQRTVAMHAAPVELRQMVIDLERDRSLWDALRGVWQAWPGRVQP